MEVGLCFLIISILSFVQNNKIAFVVFLVIGFAFLILILIIMIKDRIENRYSDEHRLKEEKRRLQETRNTATVKRLSAGDIDAFLKKSSDMISELNGQEVYGIDLAEKLFDSDILCSFFLGDYDYSLYVCSAKDDVPILDSLWFCTKKLNSDDIKSLIEPSYRLRKRNTTRFLANGCMEIVYDYSTTDRESFMDLLTKEGIFENDLLMYNNDAES